MQNVCSVWLNEHNDFQPV